MEAIELKNINKYYGKGTSKVHVLKDISFKADKGEFVLILGPSGSGKSTFLTIAGILQKPTSGDVLINGTNTRNMPMNSKEKLRLNKIGFVLQSHNLVPYLTVSEQFELVDKVKNTENLSQKELEKLLESLEISNLISKISKRAFRRSNAACCHCTCPLCKSGNHPRRRTDGCA